MASACGASATLHRIFSPRIEQARRNSEIQEYNPFNNKIALKAKGPELSPKTASRDNTSQFSILLVRQDILKQPQIRYQIPKVLKFSGSDRKMRWEVIDELNNKSHLRQAQLLHFAQIVGKITTRYAGSPFDSARRSHFGAGARNSPSV